MTMTCQVVCARWFKGRMLSTRKHELVIPNRNELYLRMSIKRALLSKSYDLHNDQGVTPVLYVLSATPSMALYIKISFD